jgi:hypothetical protein
MNPSFREYEAWRCAELWILSSTMSRLDTPCGLWYEYKPGWSLMIGDHYFREIT